MKVGQSDQKGYFQTIQVFLSIESTVNLIALMTFIHVNQTDFDNIKGFSLLYMKMYEKKIRRYDNYVTLKPFEIFYSKSDIKIVKPISVVPLVHHGYRLSCRK